MPRVISDEDPKLYQVGKVGEIYDCAPCTIWRWFREGDFPAPIYPGGGPARWRASDINAHIRKLKRSRRPKRPLQGAVAARAKKPAKKRGH